MNTELTAHEAEKVRVYIMYVVRYVVDEEQMLRWHNKEDEMSRKLRVDMWYGHEFEAKKYGADAYFSDCDCVYRGNIFDDTGKMIGDYETTDSVWIEQNFNIKWR